MSETANTQAETGKKGKMSARELTTLGLLTGVLLLMSVTPLGYFHTFGLDISLMMVPVAIGAMLMGPKAGAWLGLIFGATSFYQAVTGSSAFSTMLFNINPIYAFLLCIPTRVLMGGLNPLMFVVAFVGVNGALEMPSSCIVGGIVSKAVNRALYTKKEA